MIEKMQELGIVEAIATPHTYPGLWDNNKEKIENAYDTVGTTFITKCSSEYFADEYLLALADAGTILPLKEDYLLIEFAMIGPPNDTILDALFQLKLKGHKIGGFNCAFSSNIPIGSGLSSSAALECGFLFGINKLFNLDIKHDEIEEFIKK